MGDHTALHNLGLGGNLQTSGAFLNLPQRAPGVGVSGFQTGLPMTGTTPGLSQFVGATGATIPAVNPAQRLGAGALAGLNFGALGGQGGQQIFQAQPQAGLRQNAVLLGQGGGQLPQGASLLQLQQKSVPPMQQVLINGKLVNIPAGQGGLINTQAGIQLQPTQQQVQTFNLNGAQVQGVLGQDANGQLVFINNQTHQLVQQQTNPQVHSLMNYNTQVGGLQNTNIVAAAAAAAAVASTQVANARPTGMGNIMLPHHTTTLQAAAAQRGQQYINVGGNLVPVAQNADPNNAARRIAQIMQQQQRQQQQRQQVQHQLNLAAAADPANLSRLLLHQNGSLVSQTPGLIQQNQQGILNLHAASQAQTLAGMRGQGGQMQMNAGAGTTANLLQHLNALRVSSPQPNSIGLTANNKAALLAQQLLNNNSMKKPTGPPFTATSLAPGAQQDANREQLARMQAAANAAANTAQVVGLQGTSSNLGAVGLQNLGASVELKAGVPASLAAAARPLGVPLGSLANEKLGAEFLQGVMKNFGATGDAGDLAGQARTMAGKKEGVLDVFSKSVDFPLQDARELVFGAGGADAQAGRGSMSQPTSPNGVRRGVEGAEGSTQYVEAFLKRVGEKLASINISVDQAVKSGMLSGMDPLEARTLGLALAQQAGKPPAARDQNGTSEHLDAASLTAVDPFIEAIGRCCAMKDISLEKALSGGFLNGLTPRQVNLLHQAYRAEKDRLDGVKAGQVPDGIKSTVALPSSAPPVSPEVPEAANMSLETNIQNNLVEMLLGNKKEELGSPSNLLMGLSGLDEAAALALSLPLATGQDREVQVAEDGPTNQVGEGDSGSTPFAAVNELAPGEFTLGGAADALLALEALQGADQVVDGNQFNAFSYDFFTGADASLLGELEPEGMPSRTLSEEAALDGERLASELAGLEGMDSRELHMATDEPLGLMTHTDGSWHSVNSGGSQPVLQANSGALQDASRASSAEGAVTGLLGASSSGVPVPTTLGQPVTSSQVLNPRFHNLNLGLGFF